MTFEELRSVGFVRHHDCACCGRPVGYRIHDYLALALFDPTCGCGPGGGERVLTHQELAEIPSSAAQGMLT